MEPGNSEWQRDLSISYNNLGDVERAAGNLGAARERYEAGIAIGDRLAALEAGNALWQRDLWAGNGKLGQLAEAESNIALALTHFRRAEAAMVALVDAHPDHPGFARDLGHVRADIARLS